MYIKVIKPIFDFVFALLAMVVLLPLTLIVAIYIKLDDGGSVFYKAQRLGKNGKQFTMLKYRSMKKNSPNFLNPDGSTFSSKEDRRLTKVGKVLRETSIDEMPQFINVLLGQMSILGPRPDPPEWYEKLSIEARAKYSILPGISGYTQVYYRNTLTVEEKCKSELYYVNNISFLLDARIFFLTIRRIFLKEDVYRNNEVLLRDNIILEVNRVKRINENTHE